MAEITVRKLNLERQETWSYTGHVIEKGSDYIYLEAIFDRQDTDFHGMVLKTGDLFLEIFYTSRWYNIFEIYDRKDRHLKGWYCNIGYPAEIQASSVSYVDLELDLLVFPDGRQIVLDEEEFNALPLPEEERRRAKAALAELQARSWALRSHPGSGQPPEEKSH
jgi:uncharacterized protein